MKTLLSPVEIRRINIVKYLLSHPNWISLNELTDVFEVASHTIYSDLDKLNHYFEDKPFERIKGHVRINYANMHASDRSIKYLIRNNDENRILEFLFQQPRNSLSQIESTENFYLSRSSIYRNIHKINNAFHAIGSSIYIETPSFTIKGDECDLRYYFIQYYFFYDELNQWPFTCINEEHTDDIALSIFNILKVPNDIDMRKWMKIILAVSMTRTFQGHKIPKTNSLIRLIYSYLNLLPDFKELKNSFELYFHHPLSLEVFNQIFYFFTYRPLVFPGILEKLSQFFDATTKRSLSTLENGIVELQNKYNLELLSKELLVRILHNVAILLANTTDYQWFYIKFDIIVSTFKEHFPDFANDLDAFFTDYYNTMNIKMPSFGLIFLKYTFISHWEQLTEQLAKKKKPIKVLLATNILIQSPFYFETFLANIYGDKLYIYSCNYLEINAENFDFSDYDLIISNYSVPTTPKQQVLMIDSFLDDTYWHDVIKAINEIISFTFS